VLVPIEGDSTAVALTLRERGFAVRDTVDMGLPQHIRVSIGTPAQMSAVLDALASLLNHR
jgi:histidinol-phosphate/aromatic aminotransferase/cobyric acid decarboxylase-like protein